jgi:hypothetical protein
MKKKLIKILKKLTGSVQFYKPKPKKPNWTEPKPEKHRAKTEPNWKHRAKRFEPVFCSKNRTEIDQFEPVLVFFLNSVWLLFLIKTEPNRK